MKNNIERVQKIIANRGAVSRRRAEKLIEEGRVKVNGETVKDLGTKASTDALITIDNQPIISDDKKYYFLFYKPRNVVSTMYDPKHRKTIADYFKNVPARVYPVGRLDYDVSGLILVTNDGELANFVMHPRYEFIKTYQALANGRVSKGQVKQLTQGVTIDEDNYFTKAITANLANYNQEKDESIVEMSIAEGRKHHVKKMLEAVGIDLKKLMRTKIEDIEIGDLRPGEYRSLTPHEIKTFYGTYNSVKRKEDENK
ncbi:pseudouridine synthase [Mesoplasma lactucae]|uniref:Pseudouridine synthase n=1 Tax=Mesoplasma lactucae ATCC 49193 TaxID=81460 RepID=A0A291IRB7_9MOLU|nr:pseudouridine synthase [Mesoplasma lactucae]ATG97278.1 pseudouridine synthase [Mesoplasma lactucae ATCC 49193]ATZ20272.1 ribosomal large subunit pseudouridine synthase B [Mesoplasma lactucae ATCC 49193]MCL8216443.1 Ribosomal large subunit pseudouridine synthase B [Mesoplasma lactucae ATCC 49193]